MLIIGAITGCIGGIIGCLIAMTLLHDAHEMLRLSVVAVACFVGIILPFIEECLRLRAAHKDGSVSE